MKKKKKESKSYASTYNNHKKETKTFAIFFEGAKAHGLRAFLKRNINIRKKHG